MTVPNPSALLVVPSSPGEPLVPFVPNGQRDDVDGPFDDPMGDDPADGPGVADLVLFTVGVVAVVWGTWISNTALVVVGAIVGLLGIVLPLRSLGRRARSARSAAGREVAQTSDLLVVDDASTVRLVAAYGRVIDSTTPADREAREAALTAVREVASLLGGRSPDGAAEVDYVDARTAALGRLTDGLAAREPVDGPDE